MALSYCITATFRLTLPIMQLRFVSPAEARESGAGMLLPVSKEANSRVLVIPEGAVRSESVDHVVTDAVSHVCIRAGARSVATVCLELKGETCDIEIFLEDEATLNVLCLQTTGTPSCIRQRTKIASGARLTMQNVSLGGDLTHDLVSTVAGSDATSSVDWMFYATGTERQKLSARNVFDGRNGAGEILMKGVAQDTAHTAANGLIEIGLQGGGTNTYLTQDVLMLDATAKVDAVPGLEIKTNDVKASHSATVSRVTAEDLFYFGARGIPQEEARKMYVLGFLGQITGRLPQGTWADRILEAVESKYSAQA